jgi:hypothetical protein
MPGSTCELPPINLHLPGGADAVMGDIPIEFPASPSSLDVDHEQLTVWLRFATAFSPLANLSPPESEPFIILTTANRSP